MFNNLDQSDVSEESFYEDEDETVSDFKIIQEPEAIEYEKQIINDYNNSNDKWNLFDQEILVVVKNDDVQKNGTREKLYIRNLFHLSNLHLNLCSVLMRIEKRSMCWWHSKERLQQCLKVKIPSKVLSDLFNSFANKVNFENEDFRPEKDFSNQSESSTFENKNFVCFCIVIYQILHDLYGDDGLKVENFKHSIENLFSNKDKCPGFAKLVGKLSVLDNFCHCCNNIDDIKFNSCFDNRFSVFRDLMTQSSLRMVPDKANKKIKIEKREPEKEKDIVSITDINKNLHLKAECVSKLINPNSSNNKPSISLLKIFLLIGTIITFLAFLFFLLNAILCFIPIITSIMSIIFTVAGFVLSLLQIFIAYKTDTIRLYKLRCCVKSNNHFLTCVEIVKLML